MGVALGGARAWWWWWWCWCQEDITDVATPEPGRGVIIFLLAPLLQGGSEGRQGGWHRKIVGAILFLRGRLSQALLPTWHRWLVVPAQQGRGCTQSGVIGWGGGHAIMGV